MKKYGKKGFTLIELIAVLVIMAIIALIATPLVISIIRKTRISADKRSIDAYGRSIELAIAGYLLDNGKFPTEVSQLTIEYSGNEVVCTTTQLNDDSSIYLAGCTVAGRRVDYAYGADKSPTYDVYSVGDEVTYNNIDYYVIKDSEAKEKSVTLLKAAPLTVEEVNTYGGVGTENNHVNMYICSKGTNCYQKATNNSGYGGMAYYNSQTCGYVNNSWKYDGCISDYKESEIKYVVDAWKTVQAPLAIEARLITYDELINNLGYDLANWNISSCGVNSESTPSWVYNSNYWYWTMTPYNESSSSVWVVSNNGGLVSDGVEYYHYKSSGGVVRPVIVLPKSAL